MNIGALVNIYVREVSFHPHAEIKHATLISNVNSLCFALLQFKKIRQDATIISCKEKVAEHHPEEEECRCFTPLNGAFLAQSSR